MSFFLKSENDYRPGFCYGGGGGTSGKVSFPDHMEEIHQDWLGYSGGPTAISVDLISVMDTALGAGGNPYESLTYTDPATDLAAVQSVFNDWETIADGLDEITDWDTIILNALEEGDTAFDRAVCKVVETVSGRDIQRALRAYENRASYSRNQARRRFAGQMADVNAVQGSAFMLGIAILEAEHVSNIEQFHTELTRDLLVSGVRTYLEVIVQQGQIMTSMLDRKVSYQQALTQMQAEIKRVKTVAEAEFVANEADLNAMFSEWDFRVFQYGGNALGAMGGGTALPGKPSKAGSAIGGALGGAAAGAALGPVGAIGGAVLGGLAGLFS